MVRAGDFFTGPMSTLRQLDEILTELHLPKWPSGRRWAFRKYARREGDFALAGILLFYDEERQGTRDAVRARLAGRGSASERVMQVSFRVNGDPIAVEVEPRLHLADCLRDVLGLTGTHLGCRRMHGHCRRRRGPRLSDAEDVFLACVPVL